MDIREANREPKTDGIPYDLNAFNSTEFVGCSFGITLAFFIRPDKVRIESEMPLSTCSSK